MVISRVIRRITIVITYFRGLITPLITTHEPPSRDETSNGSSMVSLLTSKILVKEKLLGHRKKDTLGLWTPIKDKSGLSLV